MKQTEWLAGLTDAEWQRLEGIRVPSLMDGFVLPDPYPERRGPDYCWHNWPPVHTMWCGCPQSTAELNWAGEGFTVRNDESTTLWPR